MTLATCRSPLVAAIAACGLLSQTVLPAPVAATQAAAKPAAPASTVPIDGGWPRLYDLPSGGTILVYQPQVASWDRQAHLVAFSAVSQRAKAGDKPAIGTIKI